MSEQRLAKKTISWAVIVCFIVTSIFLDTPRNLYAVTQETIVHEDKEEAKKFIQALAEQIEKEGKDLPAVHLHRKLEKIHKIARASDAAKKVLQITGKLPKTTRRVAARSLGEERDLIEALKLLNIGGARNDIEEFTFTPDRRLVFIIYADGTDKIFDVTTGKDLGVSIGPNIAFITPSSDNRLVSVKYTDDTGKVFDLTTGRNLEIPIEPDIAQTRFSPDSKLLAVRYSNGTSAIFDIATRLDLKIPIQPNDASVEFSPDSKLVFVTYIGGENQLFDLKAKKDHASLAGFNVSDVDFSPDNKLISVKYTNTGRKIIDLMTGDDVGIPVGSDAFCKISH